MKVSKIVASFLAGMLAVVLATLMLEGRGSSFPLPRLDPQKCVGVTGTPVSCNWGSQYSCGSLPTTNVSVADGPDCIPCAVHGGVIHNGSPLPLPGAIECGTSYNVEITCSGGPGFGCSVNWAQRLRCVACD